MIDSEGNQQIVGQIDEDTPTIAVTDEDGNTYVVTAGGVTNAGNFSGSGPGSSQTAPGGDENRFRITARFSPGIPTGSYHYGFDSPDENSNYTHYESSEIHEETYRAAWHSVATGRVVNIKAAYSTDTEGETDEETEEDQPEAEENQPARPAVTYRSEAFGTISHQSQGEEDGIYYDQLIVQGRSHENVERIYAMAAEGEGEDRYEEAVGRINIVSYDEKQIDLAIVPVNGASVDNLYNLQDSLNSIFAQAVVSVGSITYLDNIEVPDWDADKDELFDDVISSGQRSKEMNAVRKALKKAHGIDRSTYYIFLIPHPSKTPNRLGVMRRKSRYVYIFSEGRSESELAKAIAHELGHGIFHLKHSWEEADLNRPARSQSDNLMDYSSGTALRYPQWQDIHNPAWVIGLFEDDEDGAMEGADATAFEAFYTLFEVELTNEGSDLRQTLEKLKAIEDFIDFYSQCSESKWISYENTGVVPYCLWVDSESPSVPFLSGLVDGAYQEVEAVQQMDNLARALVTGTWELIDAYTIGYWDCNPERMDVRSDWLEQSLEKLQELEDESGFIAWLSEKKEKYKRDRLIEYFEECREVYEIRESVDELYAFITD